MADLKFAYPIALLLPLLYLVCVRFCPQRNEKLLFPGVHLLHKITAGHTSLQRILQFATVLLFAIALASPYRQDEVVLRHDKGYEISLILDASGSMAELHKFDIVKKIVMEFLDKRKHDKVGLTIFADFAYVAVPLTYDKESIKRLLSKIDVGIAGTQRTALYEALFMSSKLFAHSKAKEKIAILLTDGVDNTGTVPLDVAINTAKKYGIKVYVIGVGGRGDYNPYVLRRIARETGGEFFEADSVRKLQRIYRTIDKLEKSEIKTDKYVKKSYYFQYPLAGGLVLLVLYFIYRNRR